MDNEKKFKLDELPDLGSEPDKIVFTKVANTGPEPRLENFKKLNESERADALAQRWHFDHQTVKWGWVIYLVSLFVLEKSKIMMGFHEKNVKLEPAFFDSPEIEIFFKHPMVLGLLTPFLFKFKTSHQDFFDITFNGIEAVKTIDVPLFHAPTRLKMKWNDIKDVKKTTVKRREVLELYNLQGPEAQLIWDIDDLKKKVVKQVLRDLIPAKHPLRIFIEKEVA